MWLPPLILPGEIVISVDPITAPSKLPSHISLTSSRPVRCWGLERRGVKEERRRVGGGGGKSGVEEEEEGRGVDNKDRT